MISCSSKDIHFQDMSSKREQGLHVQNMVTTLDSRVNIIFFLGGGDLYDHSMSTRNVSFIMSKNLI